MTRYLPALGLLGAAVALGAGCSFYSDKMLSASTVQDAAPYAAPLALLATGAASSLVLAGVAASSAAFE